MDEMGHDTFNSESWTFNLAFGIYNTYKFSLCNSPAAGVKWPWLRFCVSGFVQNRSLGLQTQKAEGVSGLRGFRRSRILRRPTRHRRWAINNAATYLDLLPASWLYIICSHDNWSSIEICLTGVDLWVGPPLACWSLVFVHFCYFPYAELPSCCQWMNLIIIRLLASKKHF